MIGFLTPAGLKQKVINVHLMIGLTCVLACIITATTLSWHNTLIDSLPMVAGVALVTLLAGTMSLRSNLRSDFRIEDQLRRVSRAPGESPWIVETLRSEDAATEGWNRVVEKLNGLQRHQSILDRLESVVGQSSDGRWQDVLDSLPEVLIVANADGIIRYANQALAVACGWPDASAAVGQDLTTVLVEVVGGTDASELNELKTLSGGESVEICRSKDVSRGVWRVARLACTGDQHHPMSLWQITDVTQKCIVEEARDQFVFTATHELRTPLANIRAYAETLATADDIDVEQQKSFINTINGEATRLARFIDDLLNISQMEAGAITIDRHETDMERLLREVVEHITPLIEKKQQELTVKLPAKMSKLRVDKDKIASAITNLLSNANKYTPESGQLRLIAEQDEGQLAIHVEDSGIGIAEDELPKIANKFFRSDDPRVREVTGSGIGLAFSQEVARLHGGQLTIHSEINKGSRFTITLPVETPRGQNV